MLYKDGTSRLVTWLCFLCRLLQLWLNWILGPQLTTSLNKLPALYHFRSAANQNKRLSIVFLSALSKRSSGDLFARDFKWDNKEKFCPICFSPKTYIRYTQPFYYFVLFVPFVISDRTIRVIVIHSTVCSLFSYFRISYIYPLRRKSKNE